MSRPSQVRRLFPHFALAVMALVIAVIGTLRIEQWVLRRRGERLLADIQQIELRKTSFEDAQSCPVAGAKEASIYFCRARNGFLPPVPHTVKLGTSEERFGRRTNRQSTVNRETCTPRSARGCVL